jgi:hypothetical protein
VLQLLKQAPSDLGKKGEITKLSAGLDRATKDDGDLRFYASNDGKRTYLRVWEHPSAEETKPGQTSDGAARWYEVIEPKALPAEDVGTKKK